jgi:hypothetical protein
MKILAAAAAYPLMYLILWGTAACGKILLQRHMPECWLKRVLLKEHEGI